VTQQQVEVVVGAIPVPAVSGPQQYLLDRLADGATAPQLARQLHVPPNTVKSRIRALQKLLHARNSAHLVAIACRCGLLADDGLPPGAVRPDAYRVMAAPAAAAEDPRRYALTVIASGPDLWTIRHGHRALSIRGRWSYEPLHTRPDYDWATLDAALEAASTIARALWTSRPHPQQPRAAAATTEQEDL
jgi:DNA-binding CsgD family transcriptional regulator